MRNCTHFMIRFGYSIALCRTTPLVIVSLKFSDINLFFCNVFQLERIKSQLDALR